MKTQSDRKLMVSEIIKAAQLYKQNLVGKTFLYVFNGSYIEVISKSKDFKHLTGVDTSLSAMEFYKKAVKGQLQASQIYFSQRHPYSLAKKKMKHLTAISSLAMGESFMLKDIKTNTEIYKFGSTDLHFSLCFNKETDANGNDTGNCFITKSLRDEDCFSKSGNAYIITHIYSKENDEKEYCKEIYLEKGQSVNTLPKEILSLISENIIKSLVATK